MIFEKKRHSYIDDLKQNENKTKAKPILEF